MRHTNPISRRQFLRGAAGGSALVLLAACAVPTASVPADTGGSTGHGTRHHLLLAHLGWRP